MVKVYAEDLNHTSASLAEAFWQWIDECPKGVYVNHDFTDDEDNQKIHVFGFAVPKENEDA